MGVVNRKHLHMTLSFDSAAKLNTLAGKAGKPKARVLDAAVDALYQKEEETMDHKGTVITIATNKGGAGKTTSTAAIADVLSKRGNRVLVIDTDPQGNLSLCFGFDPLNLSHNYIGLLILDRMGMVKNEKGDIIHKDIHEYINHAEGYPRIDVMTADLRLDGDFAFMNADNIKGTAIFRVIIQELKRLNTYDYILVDTRPSLNNEVAAIFLASDYILIPVVPAKASLYGANATIQFLASCRTANPSLKLLGVFLTQIVGRTKSFQAVAPLVKGSWEDQVFKTDIPRAQDAINAENESRPVTTLFANTKLAKKYEQLVEEMVERIGKEA